MGRQEDPLLSVAQVARLWGTGLETVINLVDSLTIPSLDRGELIAKGRLDVPLIRRSWAEALRVDGDGAGRILDPPSGQDLHPAFYVAANFHSALDEHDHQALYSLSSLASRSGHTPKSLLSRWTEINEGGYPSNSGVGSTIYSLAPLPAIAARVFAEAPKTPRVVTRATPARLIAVLPLVEESETWKVDLPLYEGPTFLPELLNKPLPEEPTDQGPGG